MPGLLRATIASPDRKADTFIGWHINRGPDKDADFVTARQLRGRFYRPDIVNAAVRYRNVEQALAEAGEKMFQITDLVRTLPPSFSIPNPADHAQVSGNSVELMLEFQANPEPLVGVNAHVNGQKVPVELDSKALSGRKFPIRIPLESGPNDIRVVALNKIGESIEQIVHVDRIGPIALSFESTLYLVAIGVNKFEHTDAEFYDLGLAVADATAIHAILQAQSGKPYSQVKAILLSDDAMHPTKKNIEKALSTLKQARPQDTVVVFFAGHGISQGAEYYFQTRDKRWVDGKPDPNTVIGWSFLQQTLMNTSGRRILLVDAYRFGNAFNQRMAKDATDENIALLSATDSESDAAEKPEWGHGAFTYAMLSGLEGKADSYPDKLINIKELDSYVSSTVKELTESRQITATAVSKLYKDFVFVRL